MPERTYTGFAASGETAPIDRAIRFTHGQPVEVTAEEAAVLDQNPDWGGTPSGDDLDGLDREALRQIAEAEGLDVNKRLGAERLADQIREHRLAATAEVDDPQEASDG